LLVFGNGDGGGGPLSKMLENVSVKSFLLFLGRLIAIIASPYTSCDKHPPRIAPCQYGSFC